MGWPDTCAGSPLERGAATITLEVRIPPQPGWPQPLGCTTSYAVGPRPA